MVPKTRKNHTKSGWSNEVLSQLFGLEDKVPISHVILGIIGMAGLLSVAVVAPNAVQMLRLTDSKRWGKNNARYRINETLRRMQKEGVVELIQRGGNPPVVTLTKKGRLRLEQLQSKLQLQKYDIQEPWDGKWRVVIFDILEKRRKLRRRLREELMNVGFRRLQNSVWVCPYEREEAMALLKVNLKLGRDALYFVTEKMEGDKYLRKMFSLPLQ